MTTVDDTTYLLDLLGEKHNLLRHLFDEAWSKEHEVALSATEWLILSKLIQKPLAIAQVTKALSITRQATHKSIRSLEKKGFIEIYPCAENLRVKMAKPTIEGTAIYTGGKKAKQTLERKLVKSLKPKDLQVLVRLLSKIEIPA